MYIDHTGRVGLSTGAPQASLDVAAQAGDANAAIFRDASGVAVASVTTGGVFAGVQQWSFTLYDPQGLETVDDIPAIISDRLGEPVTITEVWCESDDATATINLHRTASAAATYLMPADMACGTAGSSTTAFQSGEDQLAAGATLDMLTQTVTTGAAHRINVVVKYAVH
jgi:hypothetical protein